MEDEDASEPVRARPRESSVPLLPLAYQAFFDDADGEVLADLDSGDEAPADETDMDDDAEGLETGGVPDLALHCFRRHAGPARARTRASASPSLLSRNVVVVCRCSLWRMGPTINTRPVAATTKPSCGMCALRVAQKALVATQRFFVSLIVSCAGE